MKAETLGNGTPLFHHQNRGEMKLPDLELIEEDVAVGIVGVPVE